MKKISLFLALAGSSVCFALPAHAAKTPNALLTDQRIKQVAYDANQVYEIVGTYGYQTTIEFAPDENVKVRTIGDSIAWQTVINGNRVFVKPVEPNGATNMTIVTNKRTYFFKLDSGQKQRDMTFLVRFIYPNSGASDHTSGGALNASGAPNAASLSQGAEKPKKSFDPSLLNMNYSSAGDKRTIPLKTVFDDGEFTYFSFEKNTEVPAFYLVGNDGTESAVTPRREGAYMVVERTGRMFSLRNGQAQLCVENSALKKVAANAQISSGEGH